MDLWYHFILKTWNTKFFPWMWAKKWTLTSRRWPFWILCKMATRDRPQLVCDGFWNYHAYTKFKKNLAPSARFIWIPPPLIDESLKLEKTVLTNALLTLLQNFNCSFSRYLASHNQEIYWTEQYNPNTQLKTKIIIWTNEQKQSLWKLDALNWWVKNYCDNVMLLSDIFIITISLCRVQKFEETGPYTNLDILLIQQLHDFLQFQLKSLRCYALMG